MRPHGAQGISFFFNLAEIFSQKYFKTVLSKVVKWYFSPKLNSLKKACMNYGDFSSIHKYLRWVKKAPLSQIG